MCERVPEFAAAWFNVEQIEAQGMPKGLLAIGAVLFIVGVLGVELQARRGVQNDGT